MMLSKYMTYAEEVDKCSRDRLHQMIRNCLLKKSIAKIMDLTKILAAGLGKFWMTYYKHGEARCYNADSGSDEVVPSCSPYLTLNKIF